MRGASGGPARDLAAGREAPEGSWAGAEEGLDASRAAGREGRADTQDSEDGTDRDWMKRGVGVRGESL